MILVESSFSGKRKSVPDPYIMKGHKINDKLKMYAITAGYTSDFFSYDLKKYL